MKPFIIVAVAAVIIALRVTLRYRGRRAKAACQPRSLRRTVLGDVSQATAAFCVGELCSAL